MKKFMIVFTLPSGSKYAMAGRDGNFAMVPIKDGKTLEPVFTWNSSAEAGRYFMDFIKSLPDKQAESIYTLRPDIVEVLVAH